MAQTNNTNLGNPITVAQGAFNATTYSAGFNNISPNTTLGDFIVYSGAHNVNLGVGTNGYALTANSAATNGVDWEAVTSTVSSFGLTSSQFTVASSPITTSGNITINLPASMPGRNILVNGDFQVWQRGAGGSASFAVAASTTNSHTADQWDLTTGTNQAMTVTQSAGATTGRYYARVQRNSGQTGTGSTIAFSQTLTRSQCVGLAGSVVTISFVALCGANFSAASSQMRLRVYTGTGTTDTTNGSNASFTGAATLISQSPTVSTSAASFSYTSAAIGSTITQVCVQFGFVPVGTAGANDWFEVSDVQLEVSPQATPFQRKPFNVVLKECMYWYQKSFNYAVAPAQNPGTGNGEIYLASLNVGTAVGHQQSFSTIRLASPATSTTTGYSPLAATAQAYNLTQSSAATATTFSINGSSSGAPFNIVHWTGAVGTLLGDRFIGQYGNDKAI